MVAKASASLAYTKEEMERQEREKEIGERYGVQFSDSVTVNSGSKNTGKSTTNNSGSVNTSQTNTDASTNTSVESGTTSLTENSGRVDTSQLMLSAEAVTHLTNQILGGTQGLAAVAGGQKTAGGYNSSTNQLLVNDLISRTAGEVAARSAVTKNVTGASSSLVTNSGKTTTQNIGATKSNTVQNVGGSTSTVDTENIIGGSTTATSTANEMAELTLSERQLDVKQEQDKIETKAEVEMGWIVCTELLKQKRMPNKFYKHGLKVFNKYDMRGKRGYYFWAVPAVKHLKENPKSKLSKLLEVVMNARAEYIAAEAGVDGANKTAFGWLMKHGMYAMCWTLSRTFARNYNTVKPEGASYAR